MPHGERREVIMISRNPQRQQAVTRATGATNRTMHRAQQRLRQGANPSPLPCDAGGRTSPPCNAKAARKRGLSLIELLISLAITAMLMTATMVAIDASFKAYASAAETASAQASTRMVVNRLLTLIRTSTAHGPVDPSSDETWPVAFIEGSADTLESMFIELIDQFGKRVRVEYRPGTDGTPGWLYILLSNDATDNFNTVEPLLGGVMHARFFTHRRLDRDGAWVLDRGTIDVEVAPDRDTTLAIESDRRDNIRIVASTMPRKLD
jgi:prepilin-type N-terminal cleavage/methylation domain-containing protein